MINKSSNFFSFTADNLRENYPMESSKIHIGRQHLIGSLKSLTAIDGVSSYPIVAQSLATRQLLATPSIVRNRQLSADSRGPLTTHERGNKQLPVDNHRSKAYNSNQLFHRWPEPLLADSYPCDGPKFSCQTTISRSRHWRGVTGNCQPTIMESLTTH